MAEFSFAADSINRDPIKGCHRSKKIPITEALEQRCTTVIQYWISADVEPIFLSFSSNFQLKL